MLVPRGMHWDMTADVVVVGYGCAGAVTALTARDEGADVLLVEKQPRQTHHSNTSMSGAGFLCPSDVKSAVEYLGVLCRAGEVPYWAEKDMIRAWAEYTTQNKSWLEARGVNFQRVRVAEYDIPGHENITRYFMEGGGFVLAKLLSRLLSEKNILVTYNTSASKLLTNSKGEVIGIEAENRTDGKVKTVRIRASKGVVLTCGGFEFNEQMKLNYLRVYPTYFGGSEANTGDGIRIAMGVGADLWHMNCVSAWFVMKFPDFPIAFYPILEPGIGQTAHPDERKLDPSELCGYIFVDRYAKRFTNEDIKSSMHGYYYELCLFDGRRLIYPRAPHYWIFDNNRMEQGPLPRLTGGALVALPVFISGARTIAKK